MEKRGDEVHMDETEASAGSKENVVRWVLLVGLVLAIAFLTVIWMTGALTHDGYEPQSDAPGAEAPATDAGMDTTKAMSEEQTSLEDGLEVIEN